LGIALSLRRRIFEPFFSTKTDRSGTGLGLSSVKALVERVGGWVEVESEERAGTSFHVFLPLAAEGLMVLGATEAETPIRVLICDDESRLADLTAGLLEEFGYRATSVAQGAAALDVLTHKPRAQLLILDVNLSAGLSAAAVLRGMLDASVNIPVILTSGLAPEEVPLELREHPLVVSYLGKPYTVEELTSGIEQALKSPRVPSDWSPGVLT
jgi:CheY-like chemotaxis protein